MSRWHIGMLALAASALAVAANCAGSEKAESELVHRAINAACHKHTPDGVDHFVARHQVGQRDTRKNVMTGWRRRFNTALGRLTIDRIAPRGSLYHMTLTLDVMHAGELRPTLLAVTRPNCALKEARRLRYAPDGRPASLEYLDTRMERVLQQLTLNPDVPATGTSEGVPVAVIDSGVNYTLPEISSRLARDADGTLIGYDYWDMDPRPFDAHPARSAFSIDRHGTSVASRILRDAPIATLAPYRYPRQHMQRMAALVEDIARHDVRIANISLVSRARRDWQPFREAASAHPDILFVVAAGNNHRSLDRAAYFPASFDLANILVVTSANADASIASGVNWSATEVDIMIFAQDLPATGFDGAQRMFSGSSYAAARVSALAACLLDAHPTWRAAELKASLIDNASRHPAPRWVRHGLLDFEALRREIPCAKHIE